MTQTPPAGGANTPKDNSGRNNSDKHNPEDRSADRPERNSANDVIDTKPIPEARNEIVKLLLRHTKMVCARITARRGSRPVFSRN